MLVKELMTQGVESVVPTSTVRNAAEKMSQLNVGFLPVAQNGKAMGVLTDRDIALRVVAAGRNPEETIVCDIMTIATETLSEESDVRDAIKLMREKKIRRVVVRKSDDTISGVISLGDLAVSLDNKELCAETLKDISDPSEPER